MCLVCIAFASWVLKSSDPEATDTWKAVTHIEILCSSASKCECSVSNPVPAAVCEEETSSR
uniref:Uncharacterized protein n=1 Tax=Sphaeramia orbicularis TaxID=375764 RepID=A0A672Y9M2_9TELE